MAQKTRAQLAALISSIWQSNASGLIKASLVRPWYQDLIDSLPFFLDGEVGGIKVVVLSTTANADEYEANIGLTAYQDGTNVVLIFPNDPPSSSKVRFDGLPYQNIQVFKKGVGAQNLLGDIYGLGPIFFTYRSNQFQLTLSESGGGIEVISLAGAAGVYTGTPGLTAYTEGEAFILSFPDAPPANSTVNLDGLGAKNVTSRTSRGQVAQNLALDFYQDTQYLFTFRSDAFENTKVVQPNDAQIPIQHGLQPALIEGFSTGISDQFPHLAIMVDLGSGGASTVPFRVVTTPFYTDSSSVNGSTGIWGHDFYIGYGPPDPDERPVFGAANLSDDNVSLPTNAFLSSEITYANETEFVDLEDNFVFPGTPDFLLFRHNSDAKIPALTIKDVSPGAATWTFNAYEYRNVRKTHQASEIVEFTTLFNSDFTKIFPYRGFLIYTGISGGEEIEFRKSGGITGQNGVYGGNGEESYLVRLINLGNTFDGGSDNGTGTGIVEYYLMDNVGAETALYLNVVGSEDVENFIQSDGIISLNPVGGLISLNSITEFKVRAHTWVYKTFTGIKQIDVPEQDITSTILGVGPVTYIYFEESTKTIVQSANAPSVEVPQTDGDRLPIGNIDHNGANTELVVANILPQVAPTENIASKLKDLAGSGQGINFEGSQFQEWSDGGVVDEIETTSGTGFRIGGNYPNITDIEDLPGADYVKNLGGKVDDIFYGYSDNGVFNLVNFSPFDGVSDNANSYWDGATISAVGGSKWSAQRMFYFYGSGAVVICLGLSTENDLAAIMANWQGENFITPPDLKEGVFRAVLFIQGNFLNWGETAKYQILNL